MRRWEGERRHADCADEAGRDGKQNGKNPEEREYIRIRTT